MPAADDRDLMVNSYEQTALSHVVLDLKDFKSDPSEDFKDGADVLGPKMQQLHAQLLQQHEQYQKKPQVEQEAHVPTKPEASTAKKTVALLVWFTFNSMTLILNKHLFQNLDFKYPLSLTAVHMLTCFILSFMIIRVLKLVPYQPISRQDLMTKILPLSFVFCTNIVFGNFAIQYIPISFMQTVKSSVPVFTVVLQYVIYKQTLARAIYIALIPVVGGVALASCTELNFVMGGFVCALFGSFLTALQAVILHSSAVKLNPVNLILYTSPISLAMLVIPCAVFELGHMQANWQYYGQLMPIVLLTVSGVVAFALNYSSFIVSSVLSALTMTVAGNFKAVINIVTSVLIFGNPISAINWVGCMVAAGGVMWYNQLMAQKKIATK